LFHSSSVPLGLFPVVSTTPSPAPAYAIRFPEGKDGLSQDEEWCEVYLDTEWRRIRLHDYGAIYSIPGLYEHLFYQTLRCTSPAAVAGLLAETLAHEGEPATGLRVLDLGAGNGMVGEVLRTLGVAHVSGVDIEPAAARALERDRPGLYDRYLITDLCDPPARDLDILRECRFNCLATVAALGFGDIPPEAFRRAFDLIEPQGWVAFNLKESFFTRSDDSGFFRMIRALWDQGVLQVQAYKRYCHRRAISGEELYYVAMVARKMRDIPEALMRQIGTGA
jgi:Predicted methyltransferase (contains TPR repeat)